ncbi:sugar transferase [Georgenia sp. SYP-B2076]|uniref:sugar transferase n=1 Tax=Georgenia sp. SYP-B2076 TaxID=2495881 RepID=UPI0013E02EF7|nr:sugar transferase [Georgenia sp. SYP-B2076]
MTQVHAGIEPVVFTAPRLSRGLDSPQAAAPSVGWLSAYRRRLLVTDMVAVTVAVAAVSFVLHEERAWWGSDVNRPALVVTVIAAWLVSLGLANTRHRAVIGGGTAEYERVFHASWRCLVLALAISYVVRLEIGPGLLGLKFVLGLVLALVGRLVWRRWLLRQRALGSCRSTAVLVGHHDQVTRLAGELAGHRGAAFEIAGACVTDPAPGSGLVSGVPVIGGLGDVARAAKLVGADVVIVAGSDAIGDDVIRSLGWDLEACGIALALVLGVRDVEGARLRVSGEDRVPVVHVEAPVFAGPRHLAKAVFDRIVAAAVVTLIAPALLMIALVVKVSSPGPVLFRQQRIGLNGKTFEMLKFRSMVDGAHLRLEEVLGADGVGVFYKPRNDPRITRSGRVLRKYSLDELPQLFNVLRGEMSLVGPRPQIAREVAQYDRLAHRRLLVKPGCTGLWQVSGRSELTPEEGVRLDVRYAENWSISADVRILARTVKVMMTGEGAY